MYTIRRATVNDTESVLSLLRQVLEVHHKARPDLFKGNVTKYTASELAVIFKDDDRPVFVLEREDGTIPGYAFCVMKDSVGSNILTDIKTLYIDDICVDESARGQGVATALFEYVKDYAASCGCYNITLNVWEGNPGAIEFYKKMQMKPQKYGMEIIL